MLIRIRILETWGDKHYIGLNGLEIYDDKLSPLLIQDKDKNYTNPNSIHSNIVINDNYTMVADPSSVTVLSFLKNDKRTLDKLTNGIYNTDEDHNLWLTPFINSKLNDCSYNLSREMNQLIINLEKIKHISAIQFWNYSKSSSRGVKALEIYLDEKLIFKGDLKKASNSGNISTILFTNKFLTPTLGEKIQPSPVIINNNQNTLFYNEG